MPAPAPHRGLAEVVQPRAASPGRDVKRLLRIARVPLGYIADDAAGAVLEPDSDLHVVLVRARDGVDLLG